MHYKQIYAIFIVCMHDRPCHAYLFLEDVIISGSFTMSEITTALFAMDMHSSPGPDGFGPSFYKHFWNVLRDDVLLLFNDFHAGALDLDGLNRALLVQLPQKRRVSARQTPSVQSRCRTVL